MDTAELELQKRELRNRMKERLSGSEPRSRREKSDDLAQRLAVWEGWAGITAVFSFLSLTREVDTSPIHRSILGRALELGLPRIDRKDLVFHRVERPDEIRAKNRLGIREPPSDFPVLEPSAENRLLILVPGLAFDRRGRRLGRGGGFYDRLLSRHPRAVSVGLCFDFQLVVDVPAGEDDRRVAWIATDRRIVRASLAG